MVQLAASIYHQYSATPYATYVNRKNRRGLIQTYGSSKVVAAARKAFILNIINTNKKCANARHLLKKMSIDLVSSSNQRAYFASTDYCFQAPVGFENEL